MSTPGSIPPQPGPGRRLATQRWQLFVIGLVGLFAAGAVALALIALIVSPTLPPVRNLTEDQLKVPLRVYAADGQLLAEFGEERRIPITFDQIPPLMIKAVLAAEDDTFYYHHGVDFLGILRAALHNLRTDSRSQGGSTITMQVARNFFLSPKRTYSRKLKEVLLAFKIERELTKDQILELYFNKIFLGQRAYGFAAAARIYYGKPLDKLTLPEMAMLAGLPKAPSRDNPIANPTDALPRRNYVLGRMHDLGYITDAQYQAALAAPLDASPHTLHSGVQAAYVAEMVRQYMVQAYANKTYVGGFNVYTTINVKDQQAADQALRRGLLAYTRRHGYRGPVGHVRLGDPVDDGRLDDALKDYQIIGNLIPAVVLSTQGQSATAYTQDGDTVTVGWDGLSWARRYIDDNNVGAAPTQASDVVRPGDIVYLEYLAGTQGDPGPSLPPVDQDQGQAQGPAQAPAPAPGRWWLAQIPKVAGALVSIRPSDGAILALTGGFDFYESPFNRAYQAQRQPGSSFKPFIYSAAIDKGFTEATAVSAAPIVIPDQAEQYIWRPENYEKTFSGFIPLRTALAQSVNLVAVRLLQAITPDYAVDYLQRFGFDPTTLPRNLTLVLGSASVTPLQMVVGYSVFANGGFLVEPYFISRIEDANHNVLYQADPKIVCADCPQSGQPVAEQTLPVTHFPAEPVADPQPSPRYAPRVITAQNAFIMTDMLHSVITSGTGQQAMDLGRKDLSGKTGTTNDYRDAWFSGFNSDVATTVWVGFDQPQSLGHGEFGARDALPVWIHYMRTALAGDPEKVPLPPPGVVTAWVNKDDGRPALATDPNAIQDYFIQGTQPKPPSTEPGQPAPRPASEGLPEGLF